MFTKLGSRMYAMHQMTLSSQHHLLLDTVLYAISLSYPLDIKLICIIFTILQEKNYSTQIVERYFAKVDDLASNFTKIEEEVCLP